MATFKSSETPRLRELYIEELAEVQGGGYGSTGGGNTTMACCEEGPFGCCDIIPIDIDDPQ